VQGLQLQGEGIERFEYGLRRVIAPQWATGSGFDHPQDGQPPVLFQGQAVVGEYAHESLARGIVGKQE
jgi:hypothetical protein